jgi:hypothetical protein
MAGIKRLDDAFSYEMVGGKFVKSPEVFIFDTCRITIKQLEEYVWDENKGSSSDGKQQSGRPKDKNDHMPENLHRLMLHEPKFTVFTNNRHSVPHGSGITSVSDNEFDPY